jgi:two-component system CheB/CheR fusion protein
MPRSAIKTGGVDLILPAQRIGPTLLTALTKSDGRDLTLADEGAPDSYERICQLVRRFAGFDLKAYKSNTVQRRIQRRLSLHCLGSQRDYVQYLEDHPDEAKLLTQDMLIAVTAFFRDGDAFSALQKVIDRLVREKESDGMLRCWVPGCSTAEEAYSIGMLLAESIAQRRSAHEFLVFATDLDSDAISYGRDGIYPATSLEAMPEMLRKKYFERFGDDHYKVNKTFKNRIVFARQNLIDDPPFSRIDLISCRNLLIYFTRSIQKRVLSIFHYALNPEGFLFLGKSESIETEKDLFTAIDRSARIFQRRNVPPTLLEPLRNTFVLPAMSALICLFPKARRASMCSTWCRRPCAPNCGRWCTAAAAIVITSRAALPV